MENFIRSALFFLPDCFNAFEHKSSVEENVALDDTVEEGEFTGGEYAVCTVKHTTEEVQQAWAAVFPALRQSGYQPDNKPALERYTGKMIADGYCEICIPVMRTV